MSVFDYLKLLYNYKCLFCFVVFNLPKKIQMLQFVSHRENGDEMWLALLRLPSVILPQMFSTAFFVHLVISLQWFIYSTEVRVTFSPNLE